MKCIDCPYFFSDCDDRGEAIGRPCCHYQWNDGYAPCEVSETEEFYEEEQ